MTNQTFPVLEGKVAIVTGAAMGMGEATAKLFASAGAKVVVADFNDELGQKVTEEIKANGGEASFVHVDVSNEAEVEAMVKFAVDTYGELNVAVNNAARAPDQAPIADFDANVWDGIMAVDVKGVALGLKYQIRQMQAQGKGGSIINISSVSGFRPQPYTAAYNSAKHAVLGLTKTAAVEVGTEGIRVNAVAPGAVDTPMLRDALERFNFDPEAYAQQLSTLGRFAQADEIAQGSMWLASDASSYVHGTCLQIDGGYINR
ncbi:glucose 1-dehydrogenase [Gulosibacter macacae]|uniref:Glucose 1-dehydrogenase n=1 Tax=Gulosibacter macacae TaxID=2488791 RepID=A0A3P3W150_9MICO|nr:glucose 1-dehydrogenase [Gulosibacter macacae]RRJ88782.1 glucose 1-dehydrogenase [Gulosibacter macacae]